MGAPVTGLGQGDFELFEDGSRQAIQVFTAGDFPLSVALAIDLSASMAGCVRSTSSATRRYYGQ